MHNQEKEQVVSKTLKSKFKWFKYQ
jgi:hypothetical protein